MTREPYAGLATTFDTAAELYERARPGYPAALFADLEAAVGRDGAAVRVLEIGAGTGKATRGLLDLGWSVIALEPGPALAAVARRVLARHVLCRQLLTRRGDVEVVETPFERWVPTGAEPFDLVLAATSWHWLDPLVAYRRSRDVLRPDGHLAIVATEHVSPADGDPFFRAVEQVYDDVGMGDGRGGPVAPEAVAAPDVQAIARSGLFAPPVVHRYVWHRDYTLEEYLAVLSTYSNHIAASAQQRERLFAGIRDLVAARPSGTIRKHYLNLLQLARRRD